MVALVLGEILLLLVGMGLQIEVMLVQEVEAEEQGVGRSAAQGVRLRVHVPGRGKPRLQAFEKEGGVVLPYAWLVVDQGEEALEHLLLFHAIEYMP